MGRPEVFELKRRFSQKRIATVVAAVAALFCFSGSSWGYATFLEGTKHDFVDNGYNGGGVCSECHAAGGGSQGERLFKWSTSNGDAGMCSNVCHKGSMPPPDTNLTWGTNLNPPADPHKCIGGRCESCHNVVVSGPTTGQYADCLKCHGVGKVTWASSCSSGADSGKIGFPYDMEVGKFFFDTNTYISGHPVTYANCASNDCNQYVNNECLKCHGVNSGTQHPGVSGSPLLVFPSDSSKTVSAPATSGENWEVYTKKKRQEFCLSCHKGVAGSIPAMIQLQSTSVPPVPPYYYDVAVAAPVNRAATSNGGLPYFAAAGEANFDTNNFYENNGHGRATDVRAKAMNLTCLGEEPRGGETGVATGCHSVHGSRNKALLRDEAFAYTDDSSTRNVDFGTGVDTIDELGTKVCLGCHDRARIRSYPKGVGFHLWMGNSTDSPMIHVDSRCDTAPFDNTKNAIVNWGLLSSGNNMQTSNSIVQHNPQVMPHFNPSDMTLQTGRLYGTRSFDANATYCDAVGSVIGCVTCHDPHGTWREHKEGSSSGTPHQMSTTFGMTRLPTIDMGENDPLCGQCHVQ